MLLSLLLPGAMPPVAPPVPGTTGLLLALCLRGGSAPATAPIYPAWRHTYAPGGAGTQHYLKVATRTYTYTELAGDGEPQIVAGILALAAADPDVTCRSS